MINSMRGEFEASVGGRTIHFDTRLGTIAAIEDRCGDVGIVEVINKAVFGRRAKDHIALVAAALEATGREAEDVDRLAAAASVAEAEAFILALMGALGFELAPRHAEEARPLDDASDGTAGVNSPSVD